MKKRNTLLSLSILIVGVVLANLLHRPLDLWIVKTLTENMELYTMVQTLGFGTDNYHKYTSKIVGFSPTPAELFGTDIQLEALPVFDYQSVSYPTFATVLFSENDERSVRKTLVMKFYRVPDPSKLPTEYRNHLIQYNSGLYLLTIRDNAYRIEEGFVLLLINLCLENNMKILTGIGN